MLTEAGRPGGAGGSDGSGGCAERGITGVDVVRALAESGYQDVAESVLNMLKQRVVGDPADGCDPGQEFPRAVRS